MARPTPISPPSTSRNKPTHFQPRCALRRTATLVSSFGIGRWPAPRNHLWDISRPCFIRLFLFLKPVSSNYPINLRAFYLASRGGNCLFAEASGIVSQHFDPPRTLQRTKAKPLIKRNGASVADIDLQIHRFDPTLTRPLQCRSEQRRADAPTPIIGLDIKLLQPCDGSAMFRAQNRGEIGNPDNPSVV